MGKWKKRKAKSNGNETSQGDSNKANDNKMVYKFAPMTSDRSVQYATFDKVRERIVLHVQKQFDDGEDITETLRTMKKVDMVKEAPKRIRSEETDPKLRAQEDEDFEKLHDKELDMHLDRMKTYRSHLNKAHGIIFLEYCTEAMRTTIKLRPDYENDVLNDPVALLKAIADGIHSPSVKQFPYNTLTATINRWINLRQHKGEDLDDYLARYKQAANAAESLLSKQGVHEFVKSTAKYKEADDVEKLRLLTHGFARWKAYVFWENSDNDKYGLLKERTVDVYARGVDEFPETLEQARNMLASHKFEPAYYEKLKKREESTKKSSDNNKKNNNNKSQQKQAPAATAEQHAQSGGNNGNIVCFKCGETGHTTKSCKADVPDGEWAAFKSLTQKKGVSNAQAENSTGKSGGGKKKSAFGSVSFAFHSDATEVEDQLGNVSFTEMATNLAQGNPE